MAERNQELGNYGYAADMKKIDDDGSLDLLSLEYLVESGRACSARPTSASTRARSTRRRASTYCSAS